MTERTPTIFVQIASYRDPECRWTLEDLFARARRPDAITVGLCTQLDPARDADCAVLPSASPTHTKVIEVAASESRGVCWARSLAQTLFEGQDYVLMIDSHMRFVPAWDDAFLDELARCDAKKPLLSNYPPGYEPPDRLQENPSVAVMRAKPFLPNGDLRFDGENLPRAPERPLRGAFLAAGMLFTAGRFVTEIPYDPNIYFAHEEATLAARAFTHGWDAFSPSKTLIYHKYHNPQRGDRRALHWEDHPGWARLEAVSRQRYRHLLAGEAAADPGALKDLERYGLGTVRSLAEYEAFSGIDFKNKVASEKALRSGFVEGLERYR